MSEDTGMQDAGGQDAPAGLEGQSEGGAASDFSVPEEYSDRGWASKIKSQDDLYKQIDNLDSMVGKRQTPGDDASDEEWDQFFGKIGKPESPDKYTLSDPELPEGFNVPDDFKTKAQQIMHDAGLTQKQADKLYQRFLEEEVSTANQNKEAFEQKRVELDKQFDEVTSELFGDKFEEVSVKSQNIIKDALPESLLPAISELSETSPRALAAVIALTDKMSSQISEVKQKYGAEDNLGTGSQAQASAKDEVLKKLTEAKSKAKNADPFSPDRKQAQNEIEELRKQLQGFFN